MKNIHGKPLHNLIFLEAKNTQFQNSIKQFTDHPSSIMHCLFYCDRVYLLETY